MAPALLVLGARNLGGAIIDHAQSLGWDCAAVVLSDETAAAVRDGGAIAVRADATNGGQLERAIASAQEQLGRRLDAIVNATSPGARTGGTFGGGPVLETTPEDFDRYCTGIARAAQAFLQAGARALDGHGGTLVQITGGSARRAIAGRGAWAAGAAATRALTQAAALELRERGIHVALLVCDGTIDSPKTADLVRGKAKESSIRQVDVARAVEFLVAQDPRGYTHELVVTPSGDRWVP